MKKLVSLLALVSIFSLASCSTRGESSTTEDDNTADTGDVEGNSSVNTDDLPQTGNAIVVYFSATNHTEAVAQTIAEHIDSPIYELVPTDPYDSADLNYGNSQSRVSIEHAAIEAGEDVNVELETTDFDGFDEATYVFLGAPVWWQELSWVIEGFVSANDFSNKVIIPFGTSASSGFSLGNLTSLTEDDDNVTWLEPQRFRSSVASEDVIEWVDSLGFSFE